MVLSRVNQGRISTAIPGGTPTGIVQWRDVEGAIEARSVNVVRSPNVNGRYDGRLIGRCSFGCGGAGASFDFDVPSAVGFSLVADAISIDVLNFGTTPQQVFASVGLGTIVSRGLTFTQSINILANDNQDYPVATFWKTIQVYRSVWAVPYEIHFRNAAGAVLGWIAVAANNQGEEITIPNGTAIVRIVNPFGSPSAAIFQTIAGLAL